MKPISHLLRRTHLYLALFCLPWFVMYGVTSLAFSHPEWFEPDEDLYNTSGSAWTEEGSWPCTVPIPEAGEIPREIAAELLAVAGLDPGAFGAYRSGEQQVSVYIPAFWETRRLTYDVAAQRLYLYSRDPVLQHKLTGMHARAGYQHESLPNDAWAVMVDLVAVGFLVWVATGLYIWWQLPKMRRWGALALLAGILSFAAFLVLL